MRALAALGILMAATAVAAPRARMFSEESRSSKQRGCGLARKTLVARDPVTGGELRIVFDHYRPVALTETATVLVLPPMGHENTLDRFYARNLCAAGIGAALVKDWSGDDEMVEDMASHHRGQLRARVALTSVLDFVPGHVGVLGASIGALHGSMLFASEPRVRAAVLIVGGGPLWSVLARSGMSKLERLRAKRMRKLGLDSIEAYEAALRAQLPLDTTRFLPLARGKQAFMVIGLQDEVVKPETQFALWRALGKPEKREIDSGHIMTVIKAYTRHHQEIEDFLARVLTGS
jgi:hypothetical protein